MTRFSLAALAALALTGCASPLERGFEPYTGNVHIIIQDHWTINQPTIKRLTKDGWRLAGTAPRGYVVLIKE